MDSNLASIQKLHYCGKKVGNRSSCANIATRQVMMKKKGEECNIVAKSYRCYRCEGHRNTGTVNREVIDSLPFDQGYALTKINQYLNTLIDKEITSSAHSARQLKVKFVKPNTGGVMCFNEYSSKWIFVYYNQIQEVF